MDTFEKGSLRPEKHNPNVYTGHDESLSDRNPGNHVDVEAGLKGQPIGRYIHLLTSGYYVSNSGNIIDPEQAHESKDDVPPLKALSLLDRFLVVWIILAMAIGIILGNFVKSTGPALQKGKFVGVSIPIGMFIIRHFGK